MAFSRTVAHATSADGTFSAAGATAWNGTGAHSPAVAGATSGGIPYFDSTTTETCSALLAANALVIGGGAGAAPSTVAALTWGPTAGQGFTAALGTATTDVGDRYTQTWNAAGVAFVHEKHVITDTASAAGSLAVQYLGGAAGTTNLFSVDKNGATLTGGALNVGGSGVAVATSSSFGFLSRAYLFSPADGVLKISNNAFTVGAYLSTITEGILGVGTGAAGSFAGGLQLATIAGGSTGGTLTLSNTAGAWGTYALGTATTDVGVRYTQTWNAAGVTFTGHKFTITDTASAAGSLALQYLGGAAGTTNLLSVSKVGAVAAPYFLAGANGFQVGGGGVGTTYAVFSQTYGALISTTPLQWWSGGNIESGSADTGLSRISAGLIGVGTGAAGSFAGRIKLTSAIAAGVAVGSLNASPTTGEVQSVTDALTPIIGATVANGGSAKALVWYNGANWTVIGV